MCVIEGGGAGWTHQLDDSPRVLKACLCLHFVFGKHIPLSSFWLTLQPARVPYDEEIAALKDEDVTPLFFTALARVQQIHGNCKQLLRTHHQRAGLELMDVMATYQESAHERLCRWVQTECRTLAEEDGPDVPDILVRR